MWKVLRRKAFTTRFKRILTLLFAVLVCYYVLGNVVMVVRNSRRPFSVPSDFHLVFPHNDSTRTQKADSRHNSIDDTTQLNKVDAGTSPPAQIIVSSTANADSNGTLAPIRIVDAPISSDGELNSNFSWWTDNSENRSLEFCPAISPLLQGRLDQAVLLIPLLKEQDVTHTWTSIRPGGEWKPKHCVPNHKVAIILPFRDRQSHLSRLLDFLFPILQRQLLDFRIIVTEQYGHDLFNKGRIMNAAFTVAEAMGVDCVIFHDVDMFPQDDRTDYGCPDTPRHLGAYVNSLGYDLWYNNLVGGALSMRLDHYHQVNGYSNLYWGWGGEDDDMGKRILHNNFAIERLDQNIARFTMLKHTKRKRTTPNLIYKLLGEAEKRYREDGLRQKLWKIIKIERRPLYYHVYVDVGKAPDEWKGA